MRSPMVHRRRVVRVALVGDNAAELELNMPVELIGCVGALSIRLGNDSEASVEVAALARLLSSCRNASYLDVAGRSILGLPTWLPHPLVKLRTIFLNVSPCQPAEEVASLLNRLPSLERALLLPDTPSPLPADSLIPQRRLTELNLMGSHISLLPLITSRRWTPRKLTLWLSEDSNAQFQRVDWPQEASLSTIDILRLMLVSGAALAPAARFVTCCSALRRVEITDMAGELVAILPAILNHCQGLSVLSLRFLAPAARIQLQTRSICTLLAGTFPPALRALFLLVRTRGQKDAFEELLPLCRARRVRLAISLS